MKLNRIHGVIDHRILLNYRIHPDVLPDVLPSGFAPKLVKGWGLGGICQLSLRAMRPSGLPACMGCRSHNAAHRIAVVHGEGSTRQEGVYVPRRDTHSRINQLAGGSLFPGKYGHAHFEVDVCDHTYQVSIVGHDGKRIMRFEGHEVPEFPAGSVFSNRDEVSSFFRAGCTGWSPSGTGDSFDAIELATLGWEMAPLGVTHAYSSYFADTRLFPVGSVEFDSAVIMRNLQHAWIAREPLRAAC